MVVEATVEEKLNAERRVAEAKNAVTEDIVESVIGLPGRRHLEVVEKATETFAEASKERR